MKTIDLNCDLGEWRTIDQAEKDAQIMPYISSCNVACGGHAGSTHTMWETIQMAQKQGVKIGAHPSYPDKENFGRKVPAISKAELQRSLKNQVQALAALLHQVGEPLHHVKPHGALYNQAAVDEAVAQVIIEAMSSFSEQIPVYAPQGSALAHQAQKAGVKVIFEVFADRVYEEDLSLRSRALEGAVLHNVSAVVQQVEDMVMKGTVQTISGIRKPIVAHTICLHSDTKGAISLAKAIHFFLIKHHVSIDAP